MKRCLIAVLIVLLTSTSVYANDKEDILAEEAKLQEQLVQAQQIINNIQLRLIEIQGIKKFFFLDS